MSFRLVKTCGACPEQYNVFDEKDELVGYLRLRHGLFTVDYPDVGGNTVYTAHTNGDGVFDEDERDYHISRALEAIRLAHEGIEGIEPGATPFLGFRQTLNEEIERLRHAMLRYGDHEEACNVDQAWGQGPHECDCGFARFTGGLQASDESRASYEKMRKS